MTEFLTEHKIMERIGTMLSVAERADLAVAYWGQDATNKLKLSNAEKPIRILCDLWSGACNPVEIKKLLGHSHVAVKTLNDLHAKVYWTPTCAVVGSANASANGMSWENDETAGLIEAALLTEEKILLDAILKWFEDRWEEAEEVDSRLLERVRPIWWKARRGRRPPTPTQGQTILTVFDDNPGWFKELPLRLIGYEFGEDGVAEEKAFNKIKSESYSSKDLKRYAKSGVPLT
jgi:hypothetical protein